MKNNALNRKIFYRYLATYILVLLIPLLSFIYFYSYAIDILRDQYVEKSRNTLSGCKTYLDTHLSSLEQSITYFMDNEKVLVLKDSMHPYADPSSIIPILELQKELQGFECSDGFNNFVDAICVNYFRSGLIIFSNDVLFSNDTNTTISNLKDVDMIDWRLFMKKRTYYRDYVESNYSRFESGEGDSLFYINTFPVLSSQPRGTISVFINTEKMISLLNPDPSSNGYSYILDSKGNFVVGSGDEIPLDMTLINQELNGSFIEKIKGELYLTSYTTSDYNNWKLVTSVPYSEIRDLVIIFRKNIIFVIFLCSLIGIFFSFYFARKISQPIQHMSRMINKYGYSSIDNEKNRLFEIEHSLEDLLTDNSLIQERYDLQMNFLRGVFFTRLLKGNFSNIDEIERYLDKLNLPFLKDSMIVLVLEINELESEGSLKSQIDLYNMISLFINGFLIKRWDQSFYLHLQDTSHVIVILQTEGMSDNQAQVEQIETLITLLKQEIVRVKNVNFHVGIGSVVNSLLDAYHSYHEARNILIGHEKDEDELIYWYNQISCASNTYFYPIEIEGKLINYIFYNDIDNISRILDDLYVENFQNRTLFDKSIERLINNMQYTLIKALDRICVGEEHVKDIRHELEEVKSISSYKEKFNFLKSLMLSISENITQNRSDKNLALREEIKKYLFEKFQDPQLTINSTAKHFNLSEGYFSRFFKQNLNNTFSGYVEEMRIDYSYSLLKDSVLTINDISEKSGYNSTCVFRRAFKRVKGVTPNEYRLSL